MAYMLIATHTRSLRNTYIVRSPLLTAAHTWPVSSWAEGVSWPAAHVDGRGTGQARPYRALLRPGSWSSSTCSARRSSAGLPPRP